MRNDKVKILRFEQKQKDVLSTDEIMKIFGGLVRLIQRTAEYNACEKVKERIKSYNNEILKKNKQIEELLKLNSELVDRLGSQN